MSYSCWARGRLTPASPDPLHLDDYGRSGRLADRPPVDPGGPERAGVLLHDDDAQRARHVEGLCVVLHAVDVISGRQGEDSRDRGHDAPACDCRHLQSLLLGVVFWAVKVQSGRPTTTLTSPPDPKCLSRFRATASSPEPLCARPP